MEERNAEIIPIDKGILSAWLTNNSEDSANG